MNCSDEDARSNDHYSNSFTVNRKNYLDTCIGAAIDPEFREKIRYPLVVKFEGEDAIDYGGPRDELLSLMLDSIQSTIELVHTSWVTTEGPSSLDLTELYDRLYAYGLWAAVAVVQCGFTPPFLLGWFQEKPDCPFVKGANLLEVPKVIFKIPL